MAEIKIKRKKKKIKKNNDIYKCVSCGREKTRENFYKQRKDAQNATDIIPYCKTCLTKLCNDKYGDISKERAIHVLKILDKPYLHSVWCDIYKDETQNNIKDYLKVLNKQEYRRLRYSNSDFDKMEETNEFTERKVEENLDANFSKELKVRAADDFIVTDEMIDLFGSGYTPEEYKQMWKKYEFLGQNYNNQTSMHTEALVSYVRYKVKEEMAIAQGKVKEAKDWGELARNQADRAKISPNQISQADLQGGLTTFGDIAQAVEKQMDIIPILPQFRYRPNDAVDFCIWNYINYARDLEGKPAIEYKDIYSFYDKKKKEYIENTNDAMGIFKDDPTVENRAKIQKFIEIPLIEEEEDED